MQHTKSAQNIFSRVAGFIKKNIVLCVALVAAAVTSVIVPPDAEYIGYFDFKTLTCLFCVLAVVCALKNINFFYFLAGQIVKRFKNIRYSVLALVYITFIGSMLIANDMALLTFLPLGFFVLSTTSNEKYMAFTFIMQNIAANLGGMLTPFGNPQNLYLYSRFNIPTGEFMSIMLLPFAISVALITACCFIFVKSEPLVLKSEATAPDRKKVILYGSESNVSIFKSNPDTSDFCSVPELCCAAKNVPMAIVEVVDPIILNTKVHEPDDHCDCCCCCCCSCHDVPESLAHTIHGNFCDDDEGRYLTVSLGIFSVVRIVRPAQYLINATEYCIPDKECISAEDDDPCAIFRHMSFPTSEFCPPDYKPEKCDRPIGKCGC